MPSMEIKYRIAKARSYIYKIDLTLETKIFVLELFQFFSTERSEASIKTPEGMDMWYYRRILRVSVVDRIIYDGILCRMGTECEVNTTIEKRKVEYLGHIMRKERYWLLLLILLVKNLRKWLCMITTKLFRLATNKVKIALLLADIRNE